MTRSDPYSASRISRGVAYLFSGKVITSVAGICTFLLLVQSLPVGEFAAYTVLFALVELIDAITGVGLSHVVSRYVPELFVQNRTSAMRRLVTIALAIRYAVLAVFLAALYLLAQSVAALVGLGDWEWAFKAYLAVVLVRVATASLFGVLESMLHQKIAQLGAAFVATIRLALFAAAATWGVLDLKMVIMIELVTDAIGLTIMLGGVVLTLPRSGEGETLETSDWVRSNSRRMLEFGIKGYLQHLLIMPYGGSTNRLLVGGALASPDVALFGFAQSVADLMERYLPVRMLAGVIRPVLTARYARDQRFADLCFFANLAFKINAVLVCIAAVAVFSGGERMIAFITAGKYSEGGTGLLLLMCVLVVMYSLRHMLDHISHAVERNGPLIWSNVVITSSVLPGIALLPTLGVYALPLSNLAGLLIGSLVLIWRLQADGFDYNHDLVGFTKIFGAAASGFGIGGASRWADLPWIVAVAMGVAAFLGALFVLRPVNFRERELALSLVRRSGAPTTSRSL